MGSALVNSLFTVPLLNIQCFVTLWKKVKKIKSSTRYQDWLGKHKVFLGTETEQFFKITLYKIIIVVALYL